MRLLRKTLLLSTALAVSLLAMGASAQSAAAPTNLPNLSTATETTDGGGKTTAATATDAGAAKSTTGTDEGSSTTKVVITGDGSTGTNTASIPVITGGSSGTDNGALPTLPTNLPTLAGAFKIVPPSVPPTQNAPFMQHSNLPEGTVFIAVGAILGFMAMCVLLWRGLVAWSLHRSVKRAGKAQHTAMNDTKPLFRTPGPPPPQFYNYTDRDSTISLGGLGHKGGKKGGRPSTGGAAASASSLFFSPTAGAAGAGLATSGNRGSNYLPAGYYAAGSAQAGNAQSHVSLGSSNQPAISLSNLGPQVQGYSRARSMGTTPPDSPAFTAERGHMASSSTLNLSQGYGSGQERAPSAYLEDLFDGENAPPVPGHHHVRHNSGPTARY